jgi:hypothetical protein
VDDLLLFDADKTVLEETKERMEERLEGQRLPVHPGQEARVPNGGRGDLPGLAAAPTPTRLVRGDVNAFRRRITRLRED